LKSISYSVWRALEQSQADAVRLSEEVARQSKEATEEAGKNLSKSSLIESQDPPAQSNSEVNKEQESSQQSRIKDHFL
jgi:hypothetical protein